MQKFIVSVPLPARDTGTITGSDARHIQRVLRLGPGDTVSLTDGRGTDFQAEITAMASGEVCFRVTHTSAAASESPLPLTLCSGMLKHPKMDLIIQGITQLGVWEWIPFYCARTIPEPDTASLARRMARWSAIARESLKQCRRSRTIAIRQPLMFDQVMALAPDFEHRVVLWEAGGAPLSDLNPRPGANRTLVLIGPEGGFAPDEIHQARDAGFVPFSLGPRILRAETASLCAVALIQHRLGDM